MSSDREWDADEKRELLSVLSAPFKASEVKQREQSGQRLDYIDIVTTIQRLNSVLGTEWDFNIDRSTLTLLDETDKRGNPYYLAAVQANIYALGSTRAGVGADKATDPDKALKTAQAEALKKAGHQFGIGLELWDPQVRADIETHRKAAKGDRTALKKLLILKAQNEGYAGEITPDGLAQHFDVAVDDLQSTEILKTLVDLEAA